MDFRCFIINQKYTDFSTMVTYLCSRPMVYPSHNQTLWNIAGLFHTKTNLSVLTAALITANTAKILQYMGRVSCNYTHALRKILVVKFTAYL